MKIILFILLLCSCQTSTTHYGEVIDKTKGIGGLTVNRPIYFLTYNIDNGHIFPLEVSENTYYSRQIGDSIEIKY